MELTGKIARPERSTGTAPRLLGAALLVCLLCLLGSSPASAAPVWLPTTDLSAPGKDATNSAVAMDAAGDTVAVWERKTGGLTNNLQVSTRSPGGSFSAAVDLSLASTDPDVAMTPGGEAVAVWRHFDGANYVIQAATRPPGGSFSAPVDVSTTDTTAQPQDLHVVINAAGAVALVWIQKDPSSAVDPNQFSVRASVRPAGGSFSAPAIISPSPLTLGDDADSPRVAIDAAGDVTAVWDYKELAGPRSVVQTATRPAGGSFSAPITLSDTSQDASSSSVAMDSAGDAIAVWTRSNGTNFIVQESSSPPGGAFAAPVDLSATGENAATPEVAMTPAGAATVVWARPDPSGYWIVQASSGSPGGGFAAPLDLSATGQDASDPMVAVNAAGAAAVAWKRSNGSNDIVQATTRPSGGGFSPPIDLSAAGQDAVFPDVAMDGVGDATAVWRRSNGSNEIIQAAGYDADAPELRSLSIPSSGMVGVPVPFSVNPFDVWPIASTTFSFGDGASAAGASVAHTYAAKGTYRVTVASQDAAGTPVAAGGTISILPSNDFSIGGLSLSRKKGTGALAVTVPGPGKLVLSGKGVEKATKRVKRARRVKLPIRARGKALKALKKRGKVRLPLAIAFTPDGGNTLVKYEKVMLIKKLRR